MFYGHKQLIYVNTLNNVAVVFLPLFLNVLAFTTDYANQFLIFIKSR